MNSFLKIGHIVQATSIMQNDAPKVDVEIYNDKNTYVYYAERGEFNFIKNHQDLIHKLDNELIFSNYFWRIHKVGLTVQGFPIFQIYHNAFEREWGAIIPVDLNSKKSTDEEKIFNTNYFFNKFFDDLKESILESKTHELLKPFLIKSNQMSFDKKYDAQMNPSFYMHDEAEGLYSTEYTVDYNTLYRKASLEISSKKNEYQEFFLENIFVHGINILSQVKIENSPLQSASISTDSIVEGLDFPVYNHNKTIGVSPIQGKRWNTLLKEDFAKILTSNSYSSWSVDELRRDINSYIPINRTLKNHLSVSHVQKVKAKSLNDSFWGYGVNFKILKNIAVIDLSAIVKRVTFKPLVHQPDFITEI